VAAVQGAGARPAAAHAGRDRPDGAISASSVFLVIGSHGRSISRQSDRPVSPSAGLLGKRPRGPASFFSEPEDRTAQRCAPASPEPWRSGQIVAPLRARRNIPSSRPSLVFGTVTASTGCLRAPGAGVGCCRLLFPCHCELRCLQSPASCRQTHARFLRPHSQADRPFMALRRSPPARYFHGSMPS